VELVRRLNFPLVGDGAGVWSFIHIDDAAGATRLAIERESSGIYNIVDDEPAEVSVWLPELALDRCQATASFARLARTIGHRRCRTLNDDPGASSSNAKAKCELGWQPVYASWREGFRRVLSPEPSQVTHMKAV
jgi:nucleoside-diphosphate-sugar epimerase